MPTQNHPAPGSPQELAAYARLQARVSDLFRRLSTYPRMPQTVVVVPSLSLDPRELSKVKGVWHYEERMLVNLMLLRQPRTKIIYVTSAAIDPAIIDYYLALLPGVPASHARKRLVVMQCNDSSDQPLTAKILARPRVLERIAAEIDDPSTAHLVCFNSSNYERTLAVRLGIPLHSVDPALNDLGTKSGCREVFRAAGVLMPIGYERLSTHADMAKALALLKKQRPASRRAVVKLNEGFSGEGNALFYYGDLSADESDADLVRKIYDRLPEGLRYEAPQESWPSFIQKYGEMQGVVEEFVEGENKQSPSAQCRVNAVGLPQVISTHDQVLGGPSGQVFLGCRFPADDAYRLEVQDAGAQIASELADRGVIGRFGIDFVSVPKPEGGWDHYAIEVNLRKGGTTHPFLTLKFLTDGTYDTDTGMFYSQSGRPKFYFATDTIQSDRYIGLRPDDLIDISVFHNLHFHGPTERGVVFHLIGALSQFGKLGVVAIGDNRKQADFLYKQTLQVLDEETGPSWHRAREGNG
jgi:hypothetical protein